MRKRFGIIGFIGAMLSGLMVKPENTTEQTLHERRNFLLTNGGMAPIPSRMLNQRQKRKQARQSNIYK